MARVQPPAVLLGAFLLSVAMASLASIPASLASLAIAFCILIMSRPDFKIWPGQLARANFFIAFMWLFVPFSTPGEYLFVAPPFFHVSENGLRLCLLLTLKANSILFIFLAFITPMDFFQMGSALAQLKCPEKLAWLFILMPGNVSNLQREWERLFEAARLRAFSPRANFYSYGVFASIVGLIFIRAHERGKNMHEAMLLAGFTGRLPFDTHWSLKKPDFLFFLFIIFCCGVLISLDNASFIRAAIS